MHSLIEHKPPRIAMLLAILAALLNAALPMHDHLPNGNRDITDNS